MSSIDIVRAWKDEDYRDSLSVKELEHLPEHPAGGIELSDAALMEVSGAWVNPTSDVPRCLLTLASFTGCAVSYIVTCL